VRLAALNQQVAAEGAADGLAKALLLSITARMGLSVQRPGSCSSEIRGLRLGRPFTREGSGRPPHRSEHALLTHSAPTSGSDVKAIIGPRVQDSW
jgi:hypothetical protein